VDGVPPGSIIEATIELISIPPAFETRDAAEAAAAQLNEDAGRDFRAGDFAAAIAKYRQALAAFEPFYGAGVDAMTARIYRNLAASFAKVGDWQQCLHNANRVLQKTPEDLRALARKGEALMALGRIKEAAPVVARGVQLSGRNRIFIDLQTRLGGLEREDRARQNALMRKMMDPP
jgi:tetratricopeptide (TPR) repeat protein